MSEYRKGERVRITIEGDVTAHYETAGRLSLNGWDFPTDDRHRHIVTVERVAPENWPPRPGDKWRDGEGYAWFAIDVTDPAFHEEQFVELVNIYSARRRDLDTAVVEYGPWVLIDRDEQDGSARAE